MKVAVIGAGYVGLTMACFAEFGHEITLIGRDRKKIEMINNGKPPIYEPGLEEILRRGVQAKKIKATNDYSVVKESDVVFICVGTPSNEDGSIDLSQIRTSSGQIAEQLKSLDRFIVVVVKSTVVPQTTVTVVKPILENVSDKKCGVDFGIAMNPEFLKEGDAVEDFVHPDKIVLGTLDNRSYEILEKLYSCLDKNIVRIKTDPTTAEMIKYVQNSALASRVSFINEMANICEKLSVDIDEVSYAIGLDSRIGPKFLKEGPGFGGSCLVGHERIFIGNPHPSLSQLSSAFETNLNKNHVIALGYKNNSKFMRVKHITKRSYKGVIIKIKTQMGRGLEVTSDHPMVIVNDGKFVIKHAHEVKIGDRIPLITSLPYYPQDKIDLIGLINESDFLKKIKVRPILGSFSQFKDTLHSSINLPTSVKYEFFRKNYLPLEVYLMLEKKENMPFKREDIFLFTSKGDTTYTPATIGLNKNFWKLVGYYLAEGNISYEKCKRGTRARIQFHFHKCEREYIDDVCKILKQLGIKYALQYRGEITTTVVVSSRIFACLLDDILSLGSNSYEKRIPNILFFEDEAKKKALLCGLFRGDGYVEFHNNSKAVSYILGTASEELAHGLLLLLQSIGIIAGYRIKKLKKSTVPAHFIRISCFDQVKRLIFFDKKRNKMIKGRLSEYRKFISPIGFKKYDRYSTVTIKNVDKYFDKRDVFSLELCDSPHLFVTSHGMIVHNCFPKDVKALFAVAKSVGENPLMLKTILDINARQPHRLVDLAEKAIGSLKNKNIAVFGLAFKADTDDMRESPAIIVINDLLKNGAKVKAYDPKAMKNAKEIFGDSIEYAESKEECLRGVDLCMILTEWDEFKRMDLSIVKCPIVDGRRIISPKEAEKHGILYMGIGWKNTKVDL